MPRKRQAQPAPDPVVRAARPAPKVVGLSVNMPRRNGRKARQHKSDEQPTQILAITIEQRKALPTYAQDSADRLGGDALRQLAHESGIALSELAQMDDTKIREQMRYIVANKFDR